MLFCPRSRSEEFNSRIVLPVGKVRGPTAQHGTFAVRSANEAPASKQPDACVERSCHFDRLDHSGLV